MKNENQIRLVENPPSTTEILKAIVDQNTEIIKFLTNPTFILPYGSVLKTEEKPE